MTGQPKRRGRPPKELASDRYAQVFQPTLRFRLKSAGLSSGVHFIQQAFVHPTGTQWRSLPVVGPDAPDWEDSV